MMNKEELRNALVEVALALGGLDMVDEDPLALGMARGSCRCALDRLVALLRRAEAGTQGCAGKKAATAGSNGLPEQLLVDCPECGRRARIVARTSACSLVECDVLADAADATEPCWLDWETAEVEADFDYVCSECGAKIASTMQELDDMRAVGTMGVGVEVRK